MEQPKFTVMVKTKKGEVEVPTVLDADGNLNIDIQFIPKEDLL